MKIKEIAIPDPKFVHKNTTIDTTIEVMRKFRIGSVLVIDDTAHLVGIFTERDFFMKLNFEKLNFNETVESLMTRSPYTLTLEDELNSAIKLMNENGFRHIPVVNGNNHPVGIISIKDILKLSSSLRI